MGLKQIRHPRMFPFHILADVQHNTGEKIEYQWEADGKERRVNKKQPYFRDRNIEAFAQVGANTKRVPFKKCDYPLQHVMPF
jgi:hypothetical protein